MNVIRWLDKHLEEFLCVIILAAMTIAIFLQVVLRVAEAPLAWTEELARYLFVWLIYISSSYAIRVRGHIKVEIVALFLKEKGKLILDIIANICFFAFALIIAIYGWKYIYQMASVRVQYSPTLHVNMIYPYMSFALGCSLMVFRIIQDTILRIREYKAGRKKVEEVE